MELHIIPACYIDTNLVESITHPRSGYNHQKGCGTVASLMQNKLDDAFAVGIIDRDKKQIDYLREFDLILETPNLLLHKHPGKHHYMIQVCPAMEQFILDAAASAHIDLAGYSIPTAMDKLRKLTKSVNSKYDSNFRRLFSDMYNNGAPAILKLAYWIVYLRDKNYGATLDELKEL